MRASTPRRRSSRAPPGRVNLIGDHTDYNEGFALPMPVDRATAIAARPRDDRRVAAWSEGHGEAEFALPARGAAPPRGGAWGEYLQGVAWALEAVRGWEGTVASDVPAGAGLASSAALELAAARLHAALDPRAWDPVAAALAGRRAENEWVGAATGVMDQLVVAAAAPGAALLIDCRTLATVPVPLPEDVVVFVLDTGTRRRVAQSEYAERRAACARVAAALGVPALREADAAALTAAAPQLDPVDARRARHVVAENARVLDCAAALRVGDAVAAGALMDASHASLRDEFAVSSPALDAIVGAARAAPGCLGARLTGAGFAGCAVALVRADAADAFAAAVTATYAPPAGAEAAVFRCRPAGGAALEAPGG